ncbi:hypothetical protein H105_00616 [Trichophyton soudanense CBS 452.61]|uniref:Uncharacterized protein n=1 Tax=Trichophyton soudanense CBS 452.61 TaxID=1215331 RepID=A0A022Y6V7_TRISD|nr:hypothetical protein H105_00616 [Trichophyton soudanense CBS 452.61]EZG10711.1 hypothetical protein H106_00512 [Trichophyton rubrum CBS 735.88]
MAENQKFATYPSLADRVVVLTGGAMGIGACMVEQLALQGSRVIFLDIVDGAARNLVQKVTDLGVPHTPIFYHCDVTDIEGGIKPIAAKILACYPIIDAVINNAAHNLR